MVKISLFWNIPRSSPLKIGKSNILAPLSQMRFLDGGTKKASKSILDVGVENAIDAANFDEVAFLKRGGKYQWSKADMNLEWWTWRIKQLINNKGILSDKCMDKAFIATSISLTRFRHVMFDLTFT